MTSNRLREANSKNSRLNIGYVTDTTELPRIFNKLVTRLRVRPQQHKDIIIGSSMDPTPPKGFAIELSPDAMPSNSVSVEVTAIGSSERYSYALRINNASHTVVNAEVWQM